MGADDVRIAGGNFDDQRSNVLGQLVLVRCVVRNQHLVYTRHCRSLSGNAVYTAAGNQHVDVSANGRRSRERNARGRFQFRVIVFRYY